MPQHLTGRKTILIDGQGFGVGITRIDRKVNILDKYAKRTLDGDLKREILGIYFNYTVSFGPFWDMQEYSRLFNKLVERKEFHTITIPDNKTIYTFTGYISGVSDSIIYVDYDNGKRYISGLKCSFVSKVPTIRNE